MLVNHSVRTDENALKHVLIRSRKRARSHSSDRSFLSHVLNESRIFVVYFGKLSAIASASSDVNTTT